MSSVVVEQLETFGPSQCETLTVSQARAWCARLAKSRYENFSVLSSLVPSSLRDDFAAVYAFCRWADDLGDETGSPERSRESYPVSKLRDCRAIGGRVPRRGADLRRWVGASV